MVKTIGPGEKSPGIFLRENASFFSPIVRKELEGIPSNDYGRAKKMTDEQKIQIEEMRKYGLGYVRIAQRLGISENTVKSFCRRNNLAGNATEQAVAAEQKAHCNSVRPCKNCGAPVLQDPKRKPKLFCCDACRNKWWNSHLYLVKRKAMYEYTCPNCGKKFSAYGNANRKYCCHECYIEDRFGGK